MTVSAVASITVAGAAVDPLVAIEDAIFAWVRAGTGYAESNILWQDRGPIPPGAYISMVMWESARVSSDWIKTERTADDRIIYHVAGTRHPTLTLTAFSGPNTGSGAPDFVLSRIVAAYALPSVKRSLLAAGVGVGTVGKIRSMGGMRGTMYDPRASIQITLHTKLTTTVFEVGSSIEHVSGAVEGQPAAEIPFAVDRP